MIRVMTVLREYVAECDDAYGEERSELPLSRWDVITNLLAYQQLHPKP